MRGRQMGRRFAAVAIVALCLGARAQDAAARPLVTRVHGIATGIAACWADSSGRRNTIFVG